MNVQFERAFDRLIASHDVSDEAIDRLYDGSSSAISSLEIRYGLLCGNVPPSGMKAFLERAKERQEESYERAARLIQRHADEKKISERVEVEKRRQRKEKPAYHISQPTFMEPIIPKQPSLPTPQEIIDSTQTEFMKITEYAYHKIQDIESTIGKARTTEKILGVSYDSARMEVLKCLNQLVDDFRSRNSIGWASTIELIISGEIKTKQQARDYAHGFKSDASKTCARYHNKLTFDIKKARERASGTTEEKYEVWNAYRAFAIRMQKKPVLYIMKIMCEVFGNTNMYNVDSHILTVPCNGNVQFYPKQFTVIKPDEYHTPLAIIWATNTIIDSIYGMIDTRFIQDYYEAFNYRLSSSDMLYIGYGMHMISYRTDRITPALIYKFAPNKKFPDCCKVIYANELDMKRQGETDPAAKAFYMEEYFHVRNLRYVKFTMGDESLENLAIDIALLSSSVLGRYKGGAQ